MTRLAAIGAHLPATRLDNVAEGRRFGVEDSFVREKIGFAATSRKDPGQGASDLCVAAYRDLQARHPGLPAPQALVVCTQNPDRRIPHTAALAHHKLGLPESCACFDVSLGCSGYVTCLALAKGYLLVNGLDTALVFTADPYSEVLDPEDRNTWLLFGDAATATLLHPDGAWDLGTVASSSISAENEALACEHGGRLHMDGRRIFNFALRHVPPSIEDCLARAGLGKEDVDLYILHQASGYMVDTLRRRLGIPESKAPFAPGGGGNTVSSTIPLLLKEHLHDAAASRILLSGFGVGLAVATALLTRRNA